MRSGDRRLEALDRQRILGPDVDIAAVRPDGVGGDRHPFDHRMGIALEQGAVHERAGIPFVGIAHHVLLRPRSVSDEPPLTSSGEAGSAAAAQPGIGDHLNHLIRRHLGEDLLQCGVAVGRDVFLNVLRIDPPAVLEDHLLLLGEERDLLPLFHDPPCLRRLPQQALDRPSLEEVLLHDLRGVLRLHADVEDAVRVDEHHRPKLARSHAPGLHDAHLIGEPVRFDLPGDGVPHRSAVGGEAGRAGTDEYVKSLAHHSLTSIT